MTYSGKPWVHFGHLTQVVLAHAATRIKKQLCKTKLFQSEVEYLGHRVSKEGFSMIPEYVQKIKEWPIPKMGKEVTMFLGFAGHYKMIIPQYFALMNRLNGIKKTWSALKYPTTMKNQSGLFTRWNQELAGYNFTVEHKKDKENNNADLLSRSTHLAEALPLEEYAEFYDVDELVVRFEGE